jgi:hypothetical protein
LVAAYPVREKSAAAIAKCVAKYCCDYDIPENLISDRGAEFENETLANMCLSFGIKKKRTVPYNPRANGQEERSHRTFIDSLAASMSEHGGSWSDKLPMVVRAYNTTPHAITGISPFEVLRGFPPRSPGSLLWKRCAERPNTNVHQHTANIQQRLTELWDFVENKISQAADRRIKPTTFSSNWSPGDLVYRKIFPQRSGKFSDRYDGPYQLVSRISDTNWYIKRCSLPESKAFVENVSKLKLKGKDVRWLL